MHHRFTCAAGALALALLPVLVSTAHADMVAYQFTTTVRTVDPSASNFPSSLSGVAVGDSITGTITYDAASPSVANPFSGAFSLATLYSLNSASVSIVVDGVSFETWSGQVSAFVWNDDPIFGSANHDGIDFTNIASIGQPQFQIGNLLLPTGAFTSEALPTQNISPVVMDLRAAGGNIWLDSNGFLLEQVTPVPMPGAAAGGLALVALTAARRCRRASA